MESLRSVGKMADEVEGVPMSDDEMSVESVLSVEEGSPSDESDGEELYEVEDIVGMKKNSGGVKLYKVRWKGYSKNFDTWEPIENLESCLDMVEQYEEMKDNEKKKRAEDRKKRMDLMAGRQMSLEDTWSESQPEAHSQEPESLPSSPLYSITSPQTISTLKDTFWKDLEEGRINLFNTDMYSKVKGLGRASRPRSFKRLFNGHEPGNPSKNDETGKGSDIGSDAAGKKLTRIKSKGKRFCKQLEDTDKEKTKARVHSKGSSHKGRARKKVFVKSITEVSSPTTTYMSESSRDSSDVIMAQVISVATPSPPVLSCVEDYSDDSSRDLSDNRYSSPADITRSVSQSPNYSHEAMSEDTGIGLVVTDMASPEKKVKDSHLHMPENLDAEPIVSGRDMCRTARAELNESQSIMTEIQKVEKGEKVDEIAKSSAAIKKSFNELKSAKKTKLSNEPNELHKTAEKKVRLESECVKQKYRNKSSSFHKDNCVKDSPSYVPSKASVPASGKSGKENFGDKHVSNIFTGLTTVLTPLCKQRSSAVHSGARTESRMETSAGHTSTCVKQKDLTPAADYAQPLEKILNSSSLLPNLPDNKTPDKGVDVAFDIDLEDIDLEELEKQLTLSPSAQPLELSDDELKQAVLDGDYDLVKRAFAYRKLYDVEQADEMGTTLLMHAVFQNFDDIAEVLVCSGAKINAQQKNGNTALMIASEQAHICTVALLVEMGANVNIQQSSGETALMKAVKRGHKQMIRYLLESGANFSYLTYNGYSALSYAKLLRLTDIEDIIVDHISRLTAEFDKQVAITLNNTAQIISALFPLQCFPLAESEKFVISFKNEMEPITPGVGFLLFIAHVRMTSQEIKCRFYGPCAVKSVVLNGVKQPSLTEEANFVLSCHPVLPGKNELCINTESAVSSKAKLVVCAYKAQLIQ